MSEERLSTTQHSDATWEDHAAWWIEGYTDGADPEYVEQIVPLAVAELAGARRVLDVGCGEGQLTRAASELDGVELADRRRPDVEPDHRRRRAWARRRLRPRRGRPPAVPRRRRSTRPWRASSSSTSTPSTRRSPRSPGSCEPGGRFCFFLNHPLMSTPASGWIDDHVVDPPEQYWRIGPYLTGDRDRRGGRAGHQHPLRAPPTQPLRQRPRRQRPAGRADGRAGAAARVPRPGARVPGGGDRAPAALSPERQDRPLASLATWRRSC